MMLRPLLTLRRRVSTASPTAHVIATTRVRATRRLETVLGVRGGRTSRDVMIGCNTLAPLLNQARLG